jgi:UDP-glucose 4-epimerase
MGSSMIKRILVTGAAGFIGSHLCDALLAKDYEIIAIDNLSMGKLENVSQCQEHPGFAFHKADVVDAEAMQTLGASAEAIVHLAAFKIPRYGKAIDTARINVLGAFNMLDVAAKTGAKVVAASTSDVYGKNPDLPFSEEHDSVIGPSTIPRWGYAVSKLFEEHLALSYQAAYGFPVSLARLFGSYGPRHHLSWWGGPQSVFINAVLKDEEAEIHGDGLQTRSFCYVSDTVDGLVRMIESDRANGQIFNIGSVREITIKDLAYLIKKLSRTPGELKVRFVPYEEFGKYEDVRRRMPNIDKARKLLGFNPRVSLEEGLERTIAWQSAGLSF